MPNKDTVGIIGKTELTDEENGLLHLLGRTIGRAKKTLVLVPAPGTNAVVRVGCESEGGKILCLKADTIAYSAHTFVYADERLMTRLKAKYKSTLTDPTIFLMQNPDDLREWLDAAKTVLTERNIEWPESSSS